jgi:hypothetical protein
MREKNMKKTGKILLPLLALTLGGCAFSSTPASSAASSADPAPSEEALTRFLSQAKSNDCLVKEEGLRNATLSYFGHKQAFYLDYEDPSSADFGYVYNAEQRDCLRYSKKADGSLSIDAFIAPAKEKLALPFFPSDLASEEVRPIYALTQTPYLYDVKIGNTGSDLLSGLYAMMYFGASEESATRASEQTESIRLRLSSDGSSGTFSFRFTDRSYFLSLTLSSFGEVKDEAVNAYLASPSALAAPSAFSNRFLYLEQRVYGSPNATLIPFPSASILSERFREDSLSLHPIFRLWPRERATNYALRTAYASQLSALGFTLSESYVDGETGEDCERYSHILLDGEDHETTSLGYLTLGMNLNADYPALSVEASHYIPPTVHTTTNLDSLNATIAHYNSFSYPSFPLLPLEAALTEATMSDAAVANEVVFDIEAYLVMTSATSPTYQADYSALLLASGFSDITSSDSSARLYQKGDYVFASVQGNGASVTIHLENRFSA